MLGPAPAKANVGPSADTVAPPAQKPRLALACRRPPAAMPVPCRLSHKGKQLSLLAESRSFTWGCKWYSTYRLAEGVTAA